MSVKSVDDLRAKGKLMAEYLRAHPKCLIEAANLAAGIMPRTYARYMAGETEADLAFQQEVYPALVEHAEGMVEAAEKDIGSAENGSNAWSNWHKWLIEKRHARFFANTQSVELTGKDGGPVKNEHSLAGMPTDKLIDLWLQTGKEAEE